MSRIGKSPITVPAGVTFENQGATLVVTGPKGKVIVLMAPGITLKQEGTNLDILSAGEDKDSRSLHGLTRSLINNAVVGVTTGWEKTVELIGVGYRVSGGANEITLQVGFSHPVKVTAPAGITFAIKDNTKIAVAGIDKKLVGEITAGLRAIHPPEPYKGKGIRYLGEVVRKKAGKAVKTATAS